MADPKTIDREQLRELAANPDNSSEAISQALGLGKAHNLYYAFQVNPQLKEIYEAARAEAREKSGTNGGPKKSAAKRGRKPNTPPRNSRSKVAEGISPELLRRIWLEFEHIAVYDEVSGHFEEVRDQVAALNA